MTKHCPDSFDETLISGYLDGELTQAAEQKARVHLEDCATCSGLLADLRKMREATMSTVFSRPDDSQWDERPRGRLSGMARRTGWILAIIWLTIVGAFALWEFWQSPTHLLGKLFVVGGLSAVTLLFASVLLDRIHVAKTDPYREVEK